MWTCLFKISRLWFCGQAGGPWAWWWLSWRGWRRGWCLRRDRRGKPQWPPGGRGQRSSGIWGRSWTQKRSRGRVSGRGAFWWGGQLTSGTSWSLWGRLFRVWSGGASWRRWWRGPTFWRSSGQRVAFWGPSGQWTSLRFVLCGPF